MSKRTSWNAGYKRKVKNKLGKRRGWRCHYCHKPLTVETATLDHKTPIILGGSEFQFNKVLACKRCNQRKADKPYEVFMKELADEKNVLDKPT